MDTGLRSSGLMSDTFIPVFYTGSCLRFDVGRCRSFLLPANLLPRYINKCKYDPWRHSTLSYNKKLGSGLFNGSLLLVVIYVHIVPKIILHPNFLQVNILSSRIIIKLKFLQDKLYQNNMKNFSYALKKRKQTENLSIVSLLFNYQILEPLFRRYRIL